jgi:hypothetical protein
MKTWAWRTERYPLIVRLLFVMAWVAVTPVAARELYVNVRTGADDAARPGTATAPWRTLTFAFARAALLEGTAADVDLTIFLQEGRYGVGEEFPLTLPAPGGRVTLDGGGVSEIEGADACRSLFVAGPAGVEPVRLEFVGLVFRGGQTAVTVVGGVGTAVELSIEQCSFEDTTARAVEVSVGLGGACVLTVRDSEFLRGRAGVGLEVLEGAAAHLRVEGSRFEGLCDAGSTPSAAVEAHFDGGADLEVVVERNTFHALPSAVQLTCGAPLPGPGTLLARVRGNLMEGLGDPIYLSLEPTHELDLLVAQNTFVGVRRFVIFEDNLATVGSGLPPAAVGSVSPVAWTFANNICYGVGGPSEFAQEWREEELEEGFAASGESGPVVRNNRLEKSALLGEPFGNVGVDPGFVLPILPCAVNAEVPAGPERADWRLRGDSPLAGIGVSIYAEGLSADLDGRCRFSAALCAGSGDSAFAVDLGAYEVAGFCRVDTHFVRGDCDNSGAATMSGFISLFNFLFLGHDEPACADACDTDDNGELTLVDGVRGLRFLFLGQTPPAPPGIAGGVDPTCDSLPPCFAGRGAPPKVR